MSRPNLIQVLSTDDYKVHLYYENGEIRLYDCGWMLSEPGAFEQLRDIGVFKERCTIMNRTLAWDMAGNRDTYSCIDICPDTVYQDSVRVKEDILSA
jgi:hypothetical protein